ncbi:MarR family winged helix-turn-helix transcriptional regulator [Cohnella suwonensis]|uniref:MarR family winged helix-turn-helix transcriptional regulator n=1 Tax=Cohnella suwonensis TaxID=696072 RepID=A0ABW0M2L9_9BACL
MGDMAVKCGIAPRTVTQFVDALEQANLLIRMPDPDDRRATLLKLTESALPLIAKARTAMQASAKKVLAPLPPEKLAQLFEILLQLSAPVEAASD